MKATERKQMLSLLAQQLHQSAQKVWEKHEAVHKVKKGELFKRLCKLPLTKTVKLTTTQRWDDDHKLEPVLTPWAEKQLRQFDQMECESVAVPYMEQARHSYIAKVPKAQAPTFQKLADKLREIDMALITADDKNAAAIAREFTAALAKLK